jgi:hypothetical protein
MDILTGKNMSNRSKLQKEYYNIYGNYKGSGKYNDYYVQWLENRLIALTLFHDLVKKYLAINLVKK